MIRFRLCQLLSLQIPTFVNIDQMELTKWNWQSEIDQVGIDKWELTSGSWPYKENIKEVNTKAIDSVNQYSTGGISIVAHVQVTRCVWSAKIK